VIVGSLNTIGAPSPQSLGSANYAFSTWSDGGARIHTIDAPTSPQGYRAIFVPE
jgi:hypothetical protein